MRLAKNRYFTVVPKVEVIIYDSILWQTPSLKCSKKSDYDLLIASAWVIMTGPVAYEAVIAAIITIR